MLKPETVAKMPVVSILTKTGAIGIARKSDIGDLTVYYNKDGSVRRDVRHAISDGGFTYRLAISLSLRHQSLDAVMANFA